MSMHGATSKTAVWGFAVCNAEPLLAASLSPNTGNDALKAEMDVGNIEFVKNEKMQGIKCYGRSPPSNAA